MPTPTTYGTKQSMETPATITAAKGPTQQMPIEDSTFRRSILEPAKPVTLAATIVPLTHRTATCARTTTTFWTIRQTANQPTTVRHAA